MGLQNKLFLYFLTIALVPMLLVGVFSYYQIQTELTDATVESLVSVANIQEKRVEGVIERNIENIQLIASRTQLRLSLDEYNKSGSPTALNRVKNIISDASRSVPTVTRVVIYDLEGNTVTSTGSPDSNVPVEAIRQKSVGTVFALYDIFKNTNNSLRLRYFGPLVLDGNVIGVLGVVTKADSLIAITEDYTGLGETGEVILAKRNSNGDGLFLTPLRFDAGAALRRAVPKERWDIPITPALAGEEKTYTQRGIVDYRNVEVFAVTRFIDVLEWGLVAKVDRTEVLSGVVAFRNAYLFSILFVIFTVTALSLFVSNTLSSPVTRLTVQAKALEKGDFSVRSIVGGKDEIGLLATTFNGMAKRLEDLYRGLEEKVRVRTAELEETTAKSEAILASIGDGLVFTDLEKKIVLINNAAEKILGITQETVLGKSWPSVVQAVDEDGKKIPEEKLLISKALQSKESVNADVLDHYFYTKSDSTIFPVSITASSVSVKGEPVGAIVVFRDVTNEQEIDKAKTEFVSLASHQLRTPLSAINWYAEMLLAGDAGKITDEQKKYLDEIYHGNQRMVELVNALLNVSRLELGTFMIEPEETDVVKMSKDILKGLEVKVREKKMKIHEQYDDSLPTISADKKLLRIVIENLLSNAIKYTQEEGVVDISIRKEDQNLIIIVKDNGYGIPKGEQDKIFSKLYRATNVREKSAEGTGLGLYIIKAIIEQSGGKVWFESEEGKGTSFYVSMPLTGMKKKEGTKALD